MLNGDHMSKMKKLAQKIYLLIMVSMVLLSGCARWPEEPGPGPEDPEYQLRITVEVAGEINPDTGKYYIVLDTDNNPADGPGSDINFWEDEYYYVQLDDWGFDFVQGEEGSPSIVLTDSSIVDNQLQVIINLSDLNGPGSIDFNVITTDLENITYDYLSNYLTIRTTFGSMIEDYNSLGDIEEDEDEDDFDIIYVKAEIITL